MKIRTGGRARAADKQRLFDDVENRVLSLGPPSELSRVLLKEDGFDGHLKHIEASTCLLAGGRFTDTDSQCHSLRCAERLCHCEADEASTGGGRVSGEP